MLLLVLILLPERSPARLLIPAKVTLAWNLVTDPDVVGYNLYYGTASGRYTMMLSVGITNQATVNGLTNGVTYFFAVTCVSAAGLESAYSTEIIFAPVAGVPTVAGNPAPGGGFALSSSGLGGHVFDVLATEDFQEWMAIGNVAVPDNGLFQFLDPGASRFPSRFYILHETTFIAPSSLPSLTAVTGSDGKLQLTLTGLAGHSYDVLTSADLAQWSVFTNITLGLNGVRTCSGPATALAAPLSYRLDDITFTAAGLPIFHAVLAINGLVQLQITGLPAHAYEVFATEDFLSWSLLGTATAGLDGAAVFVDASSAFAPLRSYRLRDLSSGATP